MLPSDLENALIRWATKGIRPGAFLTAVLENNLHEAVSRMSPDYELKHLKAVCEFVSEQMPLACWGSKLIVKGWEEHFRKNGRKQ